jgi:hypothetical protein
VDDAAEATVAVSERYERAEAVNPRPRAAFRSKRSKPDVQPRRNLDVSRGA